MPCNQTAWIQAFTSPRYSASAEDNAMTAYFLLDQQMGTPPNMNTYLEVDFQSIESPAQLEYLYPTRSSSDSAA